MRKLHRASLFVLATFPLLAAASPFTDDLTRCLVDKSTAEERVKVVRWMFVVESRHPAVASLAQIPQSALDQGNKDVADVFTRLTTSACVDQARKALQTDGPIAFQSSFKALGELAASELFANPQVREATSGMQKYLDSSKLERALKQ